MPTPSFFPPSPSPMAAFATRLATLQVLLPLLILSFSGYHFLGGVSSLGINYGQVGNNLPPPQSVVALLTSLKITKARIYDTNPQVLTAFAGSNIELIVTVENEMLAVLTDAQQGLQWVATHIKPYFPATRVTGIAVGNEVYKGDGDTALMAGLVPAMVSIRNALVQLGMAQYIQVSSPHSLAVLANSYPSSAGSFRTEIGGYMSQFLQFLSATGSPFWINAYPYFAYKADPARVSLDYALLNPRSAGGGSGGGAVVDPSTKLPYDNMLYAQVDAVIFAIYRMGFKGVEVKVSETGWPSRGDEDEVGATVENAATYNGNLLRRQLANEGTPLRPKVRLDAYLFALFNEDMKPGPTSERNYGLYQPDETMVYNVGLSAISTTSNTGSTSTSTSATVSLASSGTPTKVAIGGFKSVVYWMFVYLLGFQILTGRLLF